MIASSDVFITNFPLPVRERLKIAAADLQAINPRLIYGSMTAYGEVGAEAARTGFDATAYRARSGLMDMVRASAETEPARSTPGLGDHPTATALYAAIVTALYRRERTGRGGALRRPRFFRTACGQAAALCRTDCSVSMSCRGRREPASPNALANHYRCRDGRWFLMALAQRTPAAGRVPGGDRSRATL